MQSGKAKRDYPVYQAETKRDDWVEHFDKYDEVSDGDQIDFTPVSFTTKVKFCIGRLRNSGIRNKYVNKLKTLKKELKGLLDSFKTKVNAVIESDNENYLVSKITALQDRLFYNKNRCDLITRSYTSWSLIKEYSETLASELFNCK
uniref:Uncharacterized protein n=1 Tax=Euplotes harpa TaxID=151035 RepID=A0A7S3JEL6_9SPIT|mmetsp:Transcript_32782/g.37486  ORF Transcript_32782/g.37486 Transcript_32782/m.37486 type:complete len:146 (+) Transcript_32782:945-1382(+)